MAKIRRNSIRKIIKKTKRKTRKAIKKAKRKTRKSGISRKKLKYYKKKFKRFTNKYRKSKRMRGGSKHSYGCNYPQNIGTIITGHSNNTNPFLPDPNPLNSNIRPHVLSQKGGNFMYDFGLGDLLLNYHTATNIGSNLMHKYNGNKDVMPANPTHQPELRKGLVADNVIPDIPLYYSKATIKASTNTL